MDQERNRQMFPGGASSFRGTTRPCRTSVMATKSAASSANLEPLRPIASAATSRETVPLQRLGIRREQS
jgi:hypothetical protein